jgi:hypothetical protein
MLILNERREKILYFYTKKSSLQVFNRNSLPISIQEAYSMFINDKSDLKLEKYVVYSFLSRLGFIVIRSNIQHLVIDTQK